MLIEFFCPMCGKRFIPAPQHIFKENGKMYCSWTCFNHRNDNKKPQKKAKTIEQCTKEGDILRTFKSAEEASVYINGTEEGVRKACRNCTFYKGYLWRYKNDLP